MEATDLPTLQEGSRCHKLELSLNGLCRTTHCLFSRFCLGRIQVYRGSACDQPLPSWSLPLPQLHTDPSLSFKYGQGLPTSELLGKADVVSLKLHCSLVVKGVGGLGALNFYTLHGKLLKIHNCNKTP